MALLGACKSTLKSDGQSVFRVNLGTEPPSLDWSLATDHVSFNVIANLMVGLTEFDKDLKPAPVIAKSWDLLDGGRKFVFHLRDDVQWSDGKKVRAQDFEYSWKRLLNPKTGSQYAYILFDIVNAQAFAEGKLRDPSAVGVQAPDDNTLVVTLRYPASYFLAITTFEVTYPQRQDIVEKFENRWTEPSNIVTNGPFRLAAWKHENEIDLSANSTYFLGKPAIDKVSMFMVNEKTTAVTMYEQGNLDFMDDHSIPSLDKPRLSKMPGYKLVPQLRGEYYGFAVDRKPFDNPKLRQAFAMAIDRAVFPKILQGGQTPATSWIPPGMLAHSPKIGLPFNPNEAKRLLSEAGYPDGRGFPRLTLMYNTVESHRTIAEAVQQMWKKNLNIDIELENQEWKVYLDNQRTLNYQIGRFAWIADYVDPKSFIEMFITGGGNNQTGWSNKEYDRLLAEADRAPNNQQRYELYQKAEAILLDEAPIIPVYHYSHAYLLSPSVEGWYPTLLDHHPYKYVRLKPQPENVINKASLELRP